MTHEEAKTLLAVHALDAIDDPEEIRQLESHITRCRECREELDRHRAAAAALAESALGAPPSLWRRIQTDIAEGDEAAEPMPDEHRSPSRWLGIAALVALLAAASLAGLLASARSDLAETRAEVAALELEVVDQRDTIAELTSDPIEVAIRLARTSGGSIQALLDGDVGHGSVVIRPDGQGWLTDIDFQPLDETQTYQLWVIQDGAVISAGVLGSDPNTAGFHVDVDRLDGLVITIEAAGGVVSSENGASAAWLAET